MNQELKEYSNVFNGHLNNLIKVIDNILGRYKFSTDTVHSKSYIISKKTDLFLRWFFISVFILLNIKDILLCLYNIYLILTIDDSEIDTIVNKLQSESSVPIFLMGKDYTTLRCHKKRMCCLVSNALLLLYSTIMIVFYLYVGKKCRLLSGLIFYGLFIIGFAILYVLSGGDVSDTFMCHMPSEYSHLFGLDKEVQKK